MRDFQVGDIISFGNKLFVSHQLWVICELSIGTRQKRYELGSVNGGTLNTSNRIVLFTDDLSLSCKFVRKASLVELAWHRLKFSMSQV